jgi:uncharacterized protein (DUF983 family)
MQKVSCPSCGAPVEFKSHASVMAVCEFCRATITKDADEVKNLGVMSSVLEDYSRIQIGTAGVYGDRNFTVIGRIQLRYSAGMWNEWFILFDDTTNAWLGDSSGLYSITIAQADAGPLPAFDDIVPGQNYTLAGRRFTASEKRVAECIGGQGELPFKVGQGWQAKVADFRYLDQFLTLDYSDAPVPTLFAGAPVSLEQLRCQLLREDDAIKESAGKYRGKLDTLECPSCGTGIKYMPGLTNSLVCPSCQAQLDAAGPQAQVLAQGEKVERVRTSISLGTEATINTVRYQVIGVMERADDDGETWTEYLLYSTRANFFWLIETKDGWSRANVLDRWPEWTSAWADHVTFEKQTYEKLFDYTAVVRFAAGAFNWRVAAGDTVQVTEYKAGTSRLAAERTKEELTWSRSTPVAFDQLKAWFGSALRISPDASPAANGSNSTAIKFGLWIVGLNFIPLIANFWGTVFYMMLALGAIYGLAKYSSNQEKG